MRQDFPYVYSNDAKLRISVINKYWKPREEFVQNLLKKRDYPKKNNFSGFKLIGYHSFVEPEDSKEKFKPQATLIDVKFAFNTDYQPRKLGRPNILTYNASGFDFKANIFGKVDFGKEIGTKKSSAQLLKNYRPDELINTQIIAVVNFVPKQIGKIISEVLVLGLPDKDNEPILLSPSIILENGSKLY